MFTKMLLKESKSKVDMSHDLEFIFKISQKVNSKIKEMIIQNWD